MIVSAHQGLLSNTVDRSATQCLARSSRLEMFMSARENDRGNVSSSIDIDMDA